MHGVNENDDCSGLLAVTASRAIYCSFKLQATTYQQILGEPSSSKSLNPRRSARTLRSSMCPKIQTAPETQVCKVAKLDASAWFVTGMFSHVMLSKKASQRAMSHLDTSSILYWLDIRIKFSESSLQSMLSIVGEEEEDEEEEEKEQEVSCWVQRRIQGAGERRGKERRCGTFPQYHKNFPPTSQKLSHRGGRGARCTWCP